MPIQAGNNRKFFTAIQASGGLERTIFQNNKTYRVHEFTSGTDVFEIDYSVVGLSRPSKATYYDEQGILLTAGPNEPRFDHDPVTGASKGLLIEEQRTNLILNSSNMHLFPNRFDDTTTQPNYATAPNGLEQATIVTFNIDNRLRSNLISVEEGKAYNFSVYVKDVDSGETAIGGTGAAQGTLTFDFSTGQMQKNDDSWSNGSAEHVGNGWYRISGTYLAPSTRQELFGFWHSSPSRPSSILCWGAQLEESSFPTSYIKTEGSQVTRAADYVIDNPPAPYVEYLIIGGGGGGGGGDDGGSCGGGGGSGAFRTGRMQVPIGEHSVTVGNGGAGSSSNPCDRGESGEPSTFLDIVSGGGAGAGHECGSSPFNSLPGIGNGNASGSGGAHAGAGGPVPGGEGGLYGNSGGQGATTESDNGSSAGGGGGAGFSGKDGKNDDTGGNGGGGRLSSITGPLRYYAGGGGGGSVRRDLTDSIAGNEGKGGKGGGGDAGQPPSFYFFNNDNDLEFEFDRDLIDGKNGNAGEPNTGGGGGGASSRHDNQSGGAGGSGIVVLRYVLDPLPFDVDYEYGIDTDNLILLFDAANSKSIENNTWYDQSGNGYNAVKIGNPQFNQNLEFEFDGSNDAFYIERLSTSEKNKFVNFSAFAWIKTESTGATQHIVDFDKTNGFSLFLNSVGETSFGGYSENTGDLPENYELSGNTLVADGTWHYVGVTFSIVSQKIKIFVDGVVDAEYTAQQSITELAAGSKRYGFLGAESQASNENGTSTPTFNGRISTIHAYDIELAESVVLSNYNNLITRYS